MKRAILSILSRRPMWTLALALSMVSLWAGPSRAQDEPTPADQQFADALARLALDRLTVQAEAGKPAVAPSAARLQQTGILLDAALQRNPDDVELWELRGEAALRLNDPETRLNALRSIVRLESDNERAKLDLILALIERKQTNDERLTAVDNLWRSETGKNLPDSVRSRLATYAASRAAELVQPDLQQLWLRRAMRADAMNTEATMMEFAQLGGVEGDPTLVGPAAVRLVTSAPLSAEARLTLAQLLIDQAAYGRAATQFAATQRLAQGSMSPAVYRLWLLSLAAIGQDEAIDQGLNQLAAVEVQREMIAKAEAGQEQQPQKITAEQIQAKRSALPVDLRLIYLTTLDGAEETAGYTKLRDELFAAFTPEQRAKLAWMVAVQSPKGEDALALLPDAEADTTDAQLVRGILAAKARDEEKTRELLNPLADSNPAAALGLAMITGLDQAGRIRALETVAQRHPTTLAGLLASRQVVSLGGIIEPTRAGQDTVLAMRRKPASLWGLDTRLSPWLDLSAEIVRRRYEFLEPVEVEVQIANLSQVPLTMGTGETVTGSVLLQPSPRFGGKPFSDRQSFGENQPQMPLKPIFVQLDSKITLGPSERIRKRVRVDRGELGELLRDNPEKAFAVPMTVILEPIVGSQGRMGAGILGRSDVLQGLAIQGLPTTPENLSKWQADLASEDAGIRQRAAARLALELRRGSREAAAALSGFWENGTPQDRAMIAAFIPLDDASAQSLRDLAANSGEAPVQLVWLARAVDNADNPTLQSALRSRDERVRNLARSIRDEFDVESE